MDNLPFTVTARLAERGSVLFVAECEGSQVAVERYAPGNSKARRQVAARWVDNPSLRNGEILEREQIESALQVAELAALRAVDSVQESAGTDDHPHEAAARCDDEIIAELAWNTEQGRADFIVFDRQTEEIARRPSIETAIGSVIPPLICKGIVTPGGTIDGAVLVPTDAVSVGIGDTQLRQDVGAFVERYAQLPDGMLAIAVEYVFLSWVFDAFDELAYLAFRTSDVGRGKSRALETIGSICYRPLFVGGGSSAAATLRIIDVFGGTLIADEFDQKANTELAADLARILNQGFQRNRPLIKCDGEANTPRPFRCFGPKIFALRKRLGDDATESRTLSIRMNQRTRADIPINLPRERFDAEALQLRNRLLAWRFANVGRIRIDPTLADPALEDRHNQVGLPLLAVARTPEVRARIIAALREQQGEVAADRAESLAGELFAVLTDSYRPGQTVRPGDLASELNRRRAEAVGVEAEHLGRRAVTPERVARLLRRDLELARDDPPRDKVSVRYRLDPARMGQLAKRFGAGPLQPTSPTYLHLDPGLTPENGPDGPENAVGVGGVGDVGSVDPPDDNGLPDGIRWAVEDEHTLAVKQWQAAHGDEP